MLKKFKAVSVNQLNAQIKLLEIWKSLNIADYPLKIQKQVPNQTRPSTRAETNERPIEIGKKELTRRTCISDAVRVWNQAPGSIKSCVTVYQAQKEIKSFVRSLPI